MAGSDTRVLELEQEIARQNEQIKDLMALQAEKDRLAVAYYHTQQRFRTIFEESSVGMKIIDADLRILRLNNSVLRMLGYNKEELTGKRIIEFAHADFIAPWELLRLELWQKRRTSFSLDTCLLKKDQSNLWCRVTSILFEDNGETLGYTILEDISERKELDRVREEAAQREFNLQQLQLEHQKQREILAVTINTQETERKRIAEGLHNSLGQLLYGVKISLDQVELHKGESQPALAKSREILSECIRECRRISHQMMPTLLADFGLKDAVLDICRQLSGKVQFTCQFHGRQVRLDKHLEIVIYRVVQELMLNVVKHADATKASVRIETVATDILIALMDNGKGLDIEGMAGSGIGLKTISSNIHLYDGTFELSANPGGGTLIRIRLPISEAQT